jgi:hypothetical protein
LLTLGMPATVRSAPASALPTIHALARNMPVWPDRDCVQFRGGFVVVKLSNQ